MARWTARLVVTAMIAASCVGSACAGDCPATVEVLGRDYTIGCLPILDPRALGETLQDGIRTIDGFDPAVIVAIRDGCYGPEAWTPASGRSGVDDALYKRLPELARIAHHEIPVTGWNLTTGRVSAEAARAYARDHPPPEARLGLRRLIETTDLIVSARLEGPLPPRWNQASGADWRYAENPGGVPPRVFTHVPVAHRRLLDRRVVSVRGLLFHWPDRPRTPQSVGIELRGHPKELTALAGRVVVLFLQVVSVPLVERSRIAVKLADTANRIWVVDRGIAIPPSERLRADVEAVAEEGDGEPRGGGVSFEALLDLVAATCDEVELDGVVYRLALC